MLYVVVSLLAVTGGLDEFVVKQHLIQQLVGKTCQSTSSPQSDVQSILMGHA
jgi:hypothetical protein